jgi:hypothetical protein
MGLFKQMKDMKNMVEQAPEAIAQARQLGAQAQEYGAAQRAAAEQAAQASMAQVEQQAATPGSAGAEDFEPINGVTLEQYAAICKQLGANAADAAAAHAAAAALGIGAEDWDAASAGWGQRMQTNRVVGTKFRDLYIAG